MDKMISIKSIFLMNSVHKRMGIWCWGVKWLNPFIYSIEPLKDVQFIDSWKILDREWNIFPWLSCVSLPFKDACIIALLYTYFTFCHVHAESFSMRLLQKKREIHLSSFLFTVFTSIVNVFQSKIKYVMTVVHILL